MDMVKSRRDKKGAKQFDKLSCVPRADRTKYHPCKTDRNGGGHGPPCLPHCLVPGTRSSRERVPRLLPGFLG